MNTSYLVYSPEVREAMEQGKAVVALESTIISHGMPYPQNLETAEDVESIIRDQGAVPATIALIDGKIRIGMTHDELEAFAKGGDIAKVSRRDIPQILAKKQAGATTVSATMICAALAGIDVFVTGGIGGVHRGAETSMDISADLQELAKTNVAVVCAGAKSILDIGLTLEYLETHGVPVIGYETETFPAFYTRESEFGVDVNGTSPQSIAEMLRVKWDLGLNGGAVIANPVPEEDQMKKTDIDRMIAQAIQEADEQGIKGKDTTPYLLSRLKELSDGATLTTNIALVKHNAVHGAKVAVELNRLQQVNG